MLGEHGRQHDVRRNRRIAAEHAINIGALEPGIRYRELGGLAHEIERRRALMLAVGREADAGDEAHGNTTSLDSVIPGWSEGPDPESRDSPMCNCTSWLAATQRPGMTALEVTTSVIAQPSIRLRQAQHLLGNETENELRADRGDAGDQGFPQISLDMIFLGVAESAMGHHRL